MSKRSKLCVAFAAFAALGVASAPSAHAAIVNGSFETGDFTGWTTTGDATVQMSDFYAPIPNGSNQAVLTTSVNGSLGAPASVNIAGLDSFLNLAAGTLEGQSAQSGSAFKQTFHATAGDTITFKWNMLSTEGAEGFPDFAAYTLVGPGGGNASETTLANAQAATTPINGLLGAATFANETGYQSAAFNITTTGNYTLGFGVFNVIDTSFNSALLVDAVSGATGGNGGGGSTVPLPAAVFVAPIGAFVARAASKRLRKQQTV
jgi:hypothetical protein